MAIVGSFFSENIMCEKACPSSVVLLHVVSIFLFISSFFFGICSIKGLRHAVSFCFVCLFVC
jgi:hypothetical protein